MTAEQLPAAVRQFVVDYLRSVEQLEILLLLARDATRWWTAERVATELGLGHRAAESRLEELCSANLVEMHVADAVVFRFHPAPAELAPRIQELGRYYTQRRLAVLELIPSRETGAARRFADAFRLRRRDRHG